jgi:hypothetical protein
MENRLGKLMPPLMKEDPLLSVPKPIAEVNEEDSLDQFMADLPGMGVAIAKPTPVANMEAKIPYLPRGQIL